MKFFILFIAALLLSTQTWADQGRKVESETNRGQSQETEVEAKTVDPKDPIAVQPPKNKVPRGLVLMGQGNYFSDKAVVVDKFRRTLTLWQANKNGVPELIKAWPADFGKKTGDKLVVGDHKTPEGVYFFETTYHGSQLDFNEYGNRAFTMDYPNYFDRRERKTGSGIWLHAIPPTKSLLRGSRGCVVVRNDAIEEIKPYITFGNMPIVVFDHVEYITTNQFSKDQQAALKWLESWRTAWVGKQLDTYMSKYDETFRALKMNVSQWRKYKESLNEKYSQISVVINEPMIVNYKDEYVVRFMQQYQSDVHGDVGEKILYIKKRDGDLKILHEKWSEIPKEVLAAKGIPSATKTAN